MQKDIHFYLTYALARHAGVLHATAERIAWANQYTDEMEEAELHGIQTQSKTCGNWSDGQIQLTVLSVFHFLPGDDPGKRWMTTENSRRAKALVEAAMESGSAYRLGVSLHVLQDTFSHQGFSGWREPLNSCYPWYYIKSGLPNIGHAEMMAAPDVVHYVWTDPRTGEKIDNKERALGAAKQTYAYLCAFQGREPADWAEIEPKLKPMFALTDYDKRIDQICAWSMKGDIDFKATNKRLGKKAGKREFVKAASQHLADAVASFADLRWLK